MSLARPSHSSPPPPRPHPPRPTPRAPPFPPFPPSPPSLPPACPSSLPRKARGPPYRHHLWLCLATCLMETAGWREHTDSEFSLRRFLGGHSFFLEPGEGQQGWAVCIKSTLVALIAKQKQHEGLSVQSGVEDELEPELEPSPAQQANHTPAISRASVLDSQTWCVVANHGRNPIGAQLVTKLQTAGRRVVQVSRFSLRLMP